MFWQDRRNRGTDLPCEREFSDDKLLDASCVDEGRAYHEGKANERKRERVARKNMLRC